MQAESMQKRLDVIHPWTVHYRAFNGAIAQLGERLHGMQEVAGSIPAGSTNFNVYI
jgi:hypothetical protein